MKSFLKLAALLFTAALVSCGGGGSSDTPISVASGNTVIPLNTTTGPTAILLVSGKTLVYPNGVPSFGVTGSTSLTITAGVSPSWSATSSGKNADGALAFGSCIFQTTTSTFTGTALLNGVDVTVSPCVMTLSTAGLPANGSPVTVAVTISLNGTTSDPILATVSISPSGVVSINGTTITTITLKAATGA
jgi:hypothetical protein